MATSRKPSKSTRKPTRKPSKSTRKSAVRKPTVRRCVNDKAGYKFFVCFTTPPAGFFIDSGWEYREDANDRRKELAADLPAGHAHTKGRKTLERTGKDPKKLSSWQNPPIRGRSQPSRRGRSQRSAVGPTISPTPRTDQRFRVVLNGEHFKRTRPSLSHEQIAVLDHDMSSRGTLLRSTRGMRKGQTAEGYFYAHGDERVEYDIERVV